MHKAEPGEVSDGWRFFHDGGGDVRARLVLAGEALLLRSLVDLARRFSTVTYRPLVY